MLYILIMLLIILVILIILILFKNIKSTNEINSLTKEFNHLNVSLDQNNNLFKNTTDSIDKKIFLQNQEQLNNFNSTIGNIDDKIRYQNKLTNESIKEVIEKVTTLNSINSHMDNLNTNINNLSSILNDKKARGTFGEIRLTQIFTSIFGENSKIWEEQFTLSNNKIVDLILHAPNPLGNICIDAKFPLENFQNIMSSQDKDEQKKYQTLFKKDIKKHIDDIANKYIIEKETSNQAIMFIPAETIFSELHTNFEDLISYSYTKRVWISSPTTLMAILNMIEIINHELKREEFSKEIHEHLIDLKKEFQRYEIRWENLNKHLDQTHKDTQELSITSQKIIKKFNDIDSVNIK